MGQVLENKIEKKLIRSFSEETDVIIIGTSLTWMVEHFTEVGNLLDKHKEILSGFEYEFHITDDYSDFDFILDDTRYNIDGSGSVSIFTIDEFLVIRDLLILEEFEEECVYITDFKGDIYAQIRDFESDEILTFSEREDECYLMHLIDQDDEEDEDSMSKIITLAIGEYSEIETFVIDLDEDIDLDEEE